MPKPITEKEVGYQFIDVDAQQFGRRYVRALYGNQSIMDMRQYRFWRDYLLDMAIASFEWVNLPAGIPARAVEWIMLHFGAGAMFMDDGGHLFGQAVLDGNFNMYWDYNKIRIITPNENQWTRHCQTWATTDKNGDIEIHPRDAVMLWDNMARRPIIDKIEYYAERLTMYDQTMDVNRDAQWTPWVLKVPETAQGTAKEVEKSIYRKDKVLKVNDTMDGVMGYEVLNTQAPYVVGNLAIDKQKILNEALSWLGIDNSNLDKKERVSTAETLSNNEQIMMCRRARLQPRQEFCQTCKEVFGLDVQVKWAVPHMREAGEPGASTESEEGLMGNDGGELAPNASGGSFAKTDTGIPNYGEGDLDRPYGVMAEGGERVTYRYATREEAEAAAQRLKKSQGKEYKVIE